MAKGLTIIAMVIAVLVLVLFGLDSAIKIRFDGVNKLMDTVFVICATGLGYISWSTYKEVK